MSTSNGVSYFLRDGLGMKRTFIFNVSTKEWDSKTKKTKNKKTNKITTTTTTTTTKTCVGRKQTDRQTDRQTD